MTHFKTTVLALGAALAIAAASSATQAQTFPNKTVTIVVPFGAGSVTDAMARVLADKLGVMWKQSVVVENKPGLPGTVAVAKSAPDGYTLMLTSNGHTIANVINKDVPFDSVKDFAGVTVIASVPFIAIVPADSPNKTLQDFIAQAKAQPGKLNFSSAGVASTTYLAAETLKQSANINIVHVPYKGVPDATNAVIRNDVQLYFAPIPNAKELAAGNKVKMLAISADKRAAQASDVPTVKESGVPSYKYESWFGVMAPAKTPKEIVDKISQDIGLALKMPDVGEKLTSFGAIASPTTPAQFDAIIKEDTERYAQILKAAGVGAQ
ncbi:MAG: tripartite tricarboxylate transporter substrate binding protein [Pseudolabrys sp.]|nr:tripartite tricarboxylate transporter substrate binding protein [Pseudolabrys sp.]MBV9954052.1 tripartite tricarboxylate transporter substrate binding protein [Pseudolabrys sp.]